jgi:AcrR family transcriptional regulator
MPKNKSSRARQVRRFRHNLLDGAPMRRRKMRVGKISAEERRKGILAAALEAFAEQGFAAARLDDVAEKAGVAKGTLYLYFKDKEALFEALILSAVGPVLARFETLAAQEDISTDRLLAKFLDLFRAEVLETPRKKLLRLIIAEGPYFPKIARFYHRHVVSRGLALLRVIAERAWRRGELRSDALVRFPHLMFAPLLLSVVWDGLFSAFAPLDVKGLLQAHHQLIVASSQKDVP